jgi:hypothetical protein
MKHVRAFCFLAFALAAVILPVSATTTMCSFSDPDNRVFYDIEFIGHGEVAMIQFNWPGKRRSLPYGSYEVRDFDARAARIDMVYRNPGDPDFPPSFMLRGAGKEVVMTLDGKKITSELYCGY